METKTEYIERKVGKIALERLEVMGQRLLPIKELAKNANVLAKMTICETDSICLSIHSFIWVQKAEPVHLEYPSDWWQAFRQRWFPGWWLNKWPVRNSVLHLVPARFWPDRVFPDERVQHIFSDR